MWTAVDRQLLPSKNSDLRSLLQKAIRRGDQALAMQAISRLIELGDKGWLKRRSFVFVFEEVWPAADSLAEDLREGNSVGIAKCLCRFEKDRSSASLGAMALGLSLGDTSVLTFAPQPSLVRQLADQLSSPEQLLEQFRIPGSEATPELVNTVARGVRMGGWPWDKAAMLAAVLLAHQGNQILPQMCDLQLDLPFWVALDQHTSQGKQAIAQVARQLHVKASQLGWLAFLNEGVRSNCSRRSIWWRAEVAWKTASVGLSEEKAAKLWREASPLLMTSLELPAQHLAERLKWQQSSLFGVSTWD